MFKKTHRTLVSANERARTSFEALTKRSSGKDTYIDPHYLTVDPEDELEEPDWEGGREPNPREEQLMSATDRVLNMIDSGMAAELAFNRVFDKHFLAEMSITDEEWKDAKDYVAFYASQH